MFKCLLEEHFSTETKWRGLLNALICERTFQVEPTSKLFNYKAKRQQLMDSELVRVMGQHKVTEDRQRPESHLPQTALFLVPYIVSCNLSLRGN